MKTSIFAVAGVMSLFASACMAQTGIPNPLIDYPAYLRDAKQVESIRSQHRLSEDEFLQMMSEGGTILLDARSGSMFKLRHVKGAVNLSYTDFTVKNLAMVIPTKETKVLIYCNNNFLGSPVSFASKSAPASLNIATFVALHTYGYDNVYELGPLVEVTKSKLPFEGDEVGK